MFVVELQSNDVHAALGRLLDQARVAGLKLASIGAEAYQGEYRIRAAFDIRDRDVVDRLALRVSSLVCVSAIEVRGECCHGLSARSAP